MEIKTYPLMEEQILEAAENLFLEKGFAMTSTTEIAKRVGCNQALIHYYFRTKDNLFNTIFEHKFRKFLVSIFEMKKMNDLNFNDKLKYIIETHFDILRQNPKIPALILNELSRKPDQLSILREKLFPVVSQFIAELNEELQTEIREGRIRNINIADLIISMISLNLTIFIMLPVAENLLKINEEEREIMIQQRRAENVDFILKSIRP